MAGSICFLFERAAGAKAAIRGQNADAPTVTFVIYIQRNLYSDTQNAHATNLLLTHMQPDNDKHASMPRVELGILTAE